ncbi:MAG: DUF4337 family protein [Tepidisphaera sp.]|nr:DUF4337 family protein [Tepidisphaera sp.]
MAGAHTTLEHAEHAAHSGGHAGHGAGRNGKLFGVTMALIGVLIALSGALVGSERNELTRAMIEQTQAHANWTSASTKYRFILVELEKQRGKAAKIESMPKSMEEGWSPTERLIELAGDYREERSLSKAWEESYKPVVDAHFDAAEGFEHAQLVAEVGIVVASLAVLLGSRAAWGVSVALALLCLGQIGRTYFTTEHALHDAMVRVHQTERDFEDLRAGHLGANQDEQAIERLDPDGAIRAAIKARRAKVAPAPEQKSHAK